MRTGCQTGRSDSPNKLGQYDHPEVQAGVREILDVCKAHDVPTGWFHTTMDNVEQIVADGYRLLMSGSTRSYTLLHKGRAAAGRD